MPDGNGQSNKTPESGKKSGVSFFVGVVGGIIVGAMFENVGAGIAIGISLWLLGGLFRKKESPIRPDSESDEPG